MRPSFLFLPLLIVACRPAPRQDPAVVAEGFYADLLGRSVHGAPSEAELARLGPFLSDSLRSALDEARRLHDHDLVAAPSEKPAFADGNLFTSLFEGPTSFYTLAPIQGAQVKVPVHFERRDEGRSVQWVDTAYVAPHDTTWVIVDITYGGTWPMANKGTLRRALRP